ncbi:hypothetical protein CEP52_000938 [Fusarium oligoseptatum]|uniref:Uncharacterized protein n=2 Tax=Fusarium solani species complex TaxID=232080 RepID=A0A428UM61_9HYPO|nr:hypothetical protein CDV31_005372 [Fusarium ambrosium]RSM15375.1 hypothetical protein CEP52_000938 [Fusarium oligoseptatum]
MPWDENGTLVVRNPGLPSEFSPRSQVRPDSQAKGMYSATKLFRVRSSRAEPEKIAADANSSGNYPCGLDPVRLVVVSHHSRRPAVPSPRAFSNKPLRSDHMDACQVPGTGGKGRTNEDAKKACGAKSRCS